MKLLVDVQGLQTPSAERGIGRYIKGLVAALVKNFEELDIHLLLNSVDPYKIAEVLTTFPDLPLENIHYLYIFGDCGIQCERNIKNRRALESIYAGLVNKINPDFLLITSFFEIGYPNFSTVSGISNSIKKGCILYDFIPYESPKEYLYDKNTKAEYLKKIKELSSFDFLFTISDFVRKEALRYFPTAKVVSISSSSDLCQNYEENSKYKKIDLKKYLFYYGGSDKRKNLKFLLESYSLYANSTHTPISLVIALGNSPETKIILEEYSQKLKIKDKILFLLRPSDSEIVNLLRGATLFVFPSIEEGFGLPVLEAMQQGTPTICSNTSSMPEVIGFEEATFSPTNAKDCAYKMKLFIENKAKQEELKAHVLKRSKLFTWERTVKRLVSSLRGETISSNKRVKHDLFFNLIESIGVNLNRQDLADISYCIEKTLFDNVALYRSALFLEYLCKVKRSQERNYILIFHQKGFENIEKIGKLASFYGYNIKTYNTDDFLNKDSKTNGLLVKKLLLNLIKTKSFFWLSDNPKIPLFVKKNFNFGVNLTIEKEKEMKLHEKISFSFGNFNLDLMVSFFENRDLTKVIFFSDESISGEKTDFINVLTNRLKHFEIELGIKDSCKRTNFSSYDVSILEKKGDVQFELKNIINLFNFLELIKNSYSYRDVKLFAEIINKTNRNNKTVLKLKKGRYYFSKLPDLLVEGVDKPVAQGMISNSEWIRFEIEIEKNVTCIYLELAFEHSSIINSTYMLEFYIDDIFITSAPASWIQDNQVRLCFPPSLVSTYKKISVRIPPRVTSYLTDVFEKSFYLPTLFRVIGIE